MNPMYRTLIFTILLALLLLLTACGDDGDTDRAIPTIITVLPRDVPTESDNVTPDANAEITAEAVAQADLPETWTPTPTSTNDPTITVTASSTITNTPTWTPTPTPIPTEEPNALSGLVEIMLEFTPLPTEFQVSPGGDGLTPTPTVTAFIFPATAGPTPTNIPGIVTPTGTTTVCQYPAPGEFGTVLLTYPNIAAQIGCPIGTPPEPSTPTSAAQSFEGGSMLWVDGVPGTVYVLYQDGTYQTFPDTYDPNLDPESGGEQPPDGFFAPVRGFGKIWREQPGVRDRLGWATNGEAGGATSLQSFISGRMIAAQMRGDMLTLIYAGDASSGTWQSLPRATQ